MTVISITTQDLITGIDPVYFESSQPQPEVMSRISRVKTTDGSVAISNHGYSHGDRVFEFDVNFSQAQFDTIWKIIQGAYPINISIDEGLFSGFISPATSKALYNGTAKITILVGEKISENLIPYTARSSQAGCGDLQDGLTYTYGIFTPEYWSSDNLSWDFEQKHWYGEDELVAKLYPTSTWNVGFRPTKVTITYFSNTLDADSFQSIKLFNGSGLNVIGQKLSEYSSDEEIALDFSLGSPNDLYCIEISMDSQPLSNIYITDIQFEETCEAEGPSAPCDGSWEQRLEIGTWQYPDGYWYDPSDDFAYYFYPIGPKWVLTDYDGTALLFTYDGGGAWPSSFQPTKIYIEFEDAETLSYELKGEFGFTLATATDVGSGEAVDVTFPFEMLIEYLEIKNNCTITDIQFCVPND
jgi:hypothetical protein